MTVSSALKRYTTFDKLSLVMDTLFTAIENSSGPRIEPWGTPCITIKRTEEAPANWTQVNCVKHPDSSLAVQDPSDDIHQIISIRREMKKSDLTQMYRK